MKPINVLEGTENIHRAAVIEASAGTGKTFTIENIVVRLIIEDDPQSGEPIPIDKILVVTFTKAATQEIKGRILANLQRALCAFKQHLETGEKPLLLPGYLAQLFEASEEDLKIYKKRLERAILLFDYAQVFTIHKFCWKMLRKFNIESGLSFDGADLNTTASQHEKLLPAIGDYIHHGIDPKRYTSYQFKKIFKIVQGRNFFHTFVKSIKEGGAIPLCLSLEELLETFNKEKSKIALSGSILEKKLLEEVPNYKVVDRKKQLKPEIAEAIHCFCSLFDKETWDLNDLDQCLQSGEILANKFSSNNQRDSYKEVDQSVLPSLQYLFNSILGATQDDLLNLQLIEDCKKFLSQYKKEQEIFSFDEILELMHSAVKEPQFANRIRSHYSAVIIDEFQDTDPLQWEIFSTLFNDKEWKGYVQLVGDPKQSIYGFRQGDIYTYLSAIDTLGKDSLCTLNTNYRSQKDLIDGLNTLFSTAQKMFRLPSLNKELPYNPVHVGKGGLSNLPDQKAPIQFIALESKQNLLEIKETSILPWIAEELIRLKIDHHIPFDSTAILVSDRHEMLEVMKYLLSRGIPAHAQRKDSLIDSPALQSLQEALEGIYHYRHSGTLKKGLASYLIGFTNENLAEMSQFETLAKVKIQCDQLKRIWDEEGFSTFFNHFMNSSWQKEGKSIRESLLEKTHGVEFYSDCIDIAHLLMEEEASGNKSPEELIQFLDTIEELALNDDERLIPSTSTPKEAVTLMTSFASKGLEFDIVIPLGLLKRKNHKHDTLTKIRIEGRQYTIFAHDNTPERREFLEELDAEKLRLLYVALTRAKYRLYLPVVFGQGAPDPGTASPMELFMALLQEGAAWYEPLYEAIAVNNITSLHEIASRSRHLISITHLSADSPSSSTYTESLNETTLQCPIAFPIPGEPASYQSYSSLIRLLEHSKPTTTLTTIPKLPAGAETGIILHKILEEIPFSIAIGQPLENFVAGHLKNTELKEHTALVAKIVETVLTTPLKGKLCLRDLNPNSMYRETEFLFPCSKNETIEGISLKNGLMKGVIDLFFEYEGKYYLLDWKSNYLGENLEDYNDDQMQIAMQENHYHIQANLYQEAAKRYLRLVDTRPFEKCFGGVFYLFLRGVSANTGIFFIDPQELT